MAPFLDLMIGQLVEVTGADEAGHTGRSGQIRPHQLVHALGGLGFRLPHGRGHRLGQCFWVGLAEGLGAQLHLDQVPPRVDRGRDQIVGGRDGHLRPGNLLLHLGQTVPYALILALHLREPLLQGLIRVPVRCPRHSTVPPVVGGRSKAIPQRRYWIRARLGAPRFRRARYVQRYFRQVRPAGRGDADAFD